LAVSQVMITASRMFMAILRGVLRSNEAAKRAWGYRRWNTPAPAGVL